MPLVHISLRKGKSPEYLRSVADAVPGFAGYERATSREIPVVILTTSEAEPDINKSFDLYANCYITKPIDLERLSMVLGSIKTEH